MLTYVSEQHERHTRSTALDLLHIPRSHSSFFDRAFSVQGPKLWNSLPDDIRNSTSVNRFKSALKLYLLINSQSVLTRAKLPTSICTAFCRGARLKYRNFKPVSYAFVFRNRDLVKKSFDNFDRGLNKTNPPFVSWDKVLKVVHGGLKLFKF